MNNCRYKSDGFMFNSLMSLLWIPSYNTLTLPAVYQIISFYFSIVSCRQKKNKLKLRRPQGFLNIYTTVLDRFVSYLFFELITWIFCTFNRVYCTSWFVLHPFFFSSWFFFFFFFFLFVERVWLIFVFYVQLINYFS